MPVEVRRVSADDWRLWRSVRLAALAEAPQAFGSTLDDWRGATEARWRARLSIPGAVDLLAFDAGRADPVGMVTGVPHGDRAELISMWVDPAVRSRGIATELIDAVARWAATNGATRLVLSVMSDNARARATYTKNGFAVAAVHGERESTERGEVVMVRELTGQGSRER